MPWYVLITKPNAEKKVADRLKILGVEVCCPVRTELRQWSDRKKKVEVPLLPSMVLVNLEEKARPLVFEAAGALRYLFWLGRPATVSEAEIEALRDIRNQSQAKVDVQKMEVGKEIDINGLGFEKERGTVRYVSGNQCWVVLHNMGYIVKLQI